MADIYKRKRRDKETGEIVEGKTWWGRVQHNRRDFRRSLKTTDRREAEKRWKFFQLELTGTDFGEKPRRTFDDAAIRFIEDRLPAMKASSAKRYMISIRNLADHFEGLDLADIGRAALTEFEMARRKDGVTSGTIRRDLTCLSAIFNQAEELEYFDANPVKPFLRYRARRGLKEAPPRDRYFSHEEELTILTNLSVLNADQTKTPEWRAYMRHARMMYVAAVCFAIDAGLRKEEQFSLLWSNLNLERHEVHVTREVSKSGVGRTVPLLPRTLAIMKALSRSTETNYVFWHPKWRAAPLGRYYELSPRLKDACAKDDIQDVRWHDLRRTCGCRLLQDLRMSMEEVSIWLGHSSIKVTEKTYAFLDVRHLHRSAGTGMQTHGQKRVNRERELLKTGGYLDIFNEFQ